MPLIGDAGEEDIGQTEDENRDDTTPTGTSSDRATQGTDTESHSVSSSITHPSDGRVGVENDSNRQATSSGGVDVDKLTERVNKPTQTESRSVLTRVKDRFSGTIPRSLSPRKFTPAVRTRVEREVKQMAAAGDGRLLRIEPYPGDNTGDGESGVNSGKELFRELFSSEYQRKWFKILNDSSVGSFEIWMVNGKIVFHIYVPNEDTKIRAIREIDAQYSNASIEEVWDAETVDSFLERQVSGDSEGDTEPSNSLGGEDRSFISSNGNTTESSDRGVSEVDESYDDRSEVPLKETHIPLPPLDEVEYMTARDHTLWNECTYPIWSPQLEDDRQEEVDDPYKSLTSSMITDGRNQFILQITYKPGRRQWATRSRYERSPFRSSIDEVAYEWKQHTEIESVGSSQIEYGDNGKAVTAEREVSQAINTRGDHGGFDIDLRVIGLGRDKDVVRRGVSDISSTIESKFEFWDQRFKGWNENGHRSLKQLDRCITRSRVGKPFLGQFRRWKWYRGSRIVLPWSEIGVLCHFPNESVETPDISWELTRSGEAVPNSAESFGDVAKETEPVPLTETAGPDAVDTDIPEPDPSTIEPEKDELGADDRRSDPSTQNTSQEETEESNSGIDPSTEWVTSVLSSDEELIAESSQGWFVSLPQYAISLLLAVVGVVLAISTYVDLSMYIMPDGFGTTPQEFLWAGVGVVILGTLISYYEKRRRLKNRLAITNKRLIHRTGILSKSDNILNFARVDSVKKHQSFVDRKIDTGTIQVSTGGTDGFEMQFGPLPNFASNSRVIDELKIHADGHAGSTSGRKQEEGEQDPRDTIRSRGR